MQTDLYIGDYLVHPYWPKGEVLLTLVYFTLEGS